jgi:hypothetical protein
MKGSQQVDQILDSDLTRQKGLHSAENSVILSLEGKVNFWLYQSSL